MKKKYLRYLFVITTLLMLFPNPIINLLDALQHEFFMVGGVDQLMTLLSVLFTLTSVNLYLLFLMFKDN